MNAQDAVWFVPNLFGSWWWVICAVPAAIAAALLFVTMVMNHPFDLLLVARIMVVGSLVSFACAPLNSGWVPWGILLASNGGLLTSILLATKWCERPDKSVTIPVALWRWAARLLRPSGEKDKELA